MGLSDTVTVDLPPEPEIEPRAEAIPLEILYEDAELMVIDKPSGLIVHPAPGHATGTLVNAVMHHCPDFGWPGMDPQRPGIVHRLDQYTSGVLVVAKTQRGFNHLSRQAREHTFDRRYLALVRGEFPEDRGRINATIGRSTADRKRMAVTGVHGREAVTNFTVVERYGVASLVSLKLETGRTHQIRVHLRFAGRPVLGDPTYGVTDYAAWQIPETLHGVLKGLTGQALHAELLGIEHPVTGERMTFTAPPPEDFMRALDALRRFAQG
jgi:23S rRNA pseudouridine1911/1915/1917 synthase